VRAAIRRRSIQIPGASVTLPTCLASISCRVTCRLVVIGSFQGPLFPETGAAFHALPGVPEPGEALIELGGILAEIKHDRWKRRGIGVPDEGQSTSNKTANVVVQATPPLGIGARGEGQVSVTFEPGTPEGGRPLLPEDADGGAIVHRIGSQPTFQISSALLSGHSSGRGPLSRAPVQAFADLPKVLVSGQRVIVRGAEGRTLRGEVVALSDGMLEIEWRRWIFQRKHRSLSEGSVQSISIQDSDWNGTLLGVGVGILAGMLVDEQLCAVLEPSLKPVGAYHGALIGALIGGAVDRSVNQVVYRAPRREGLTFAPIIGTRRVGFTASAAF
jgi:hypothetical protein